MWGRNCSVCWSNGFVANIQAQTSLGLPPSMATQVWLMRNQAELPSSLKVNRTAQILTSTYMFLTKYWYWLCHLFISQREVDLLLPGKLQVGTGLVDDTFISTNVGSGEKEFAKKYIIAAGKYVIVRSSFCFPLHILESFLLFFTYISPFLSERESLYSLTPYFFH